MKRVAALLGLLLFLSTPAHAARRHAIGSPRVDDGTPASWLAAHASTIVTTDLSADTSDLALFKNIVGDAHVVGLGDGTHGTHEFYTMKLRLIDVLVRELGFDTIALEVEFPLFERIETYVQGGGGDARTILGEAGELGYHFWDTEEVLAVIEWVRAYNAHRGVRPAVHIAGADIWDAHSAAQNVVAYLLRVDPAAATEAQQDYQCMLAQPGLFNSVCLESDAKAAYSMLAARRSDLGGGSGARDFEDALHNARVAVQSFTFYARDENMAENVLWLREHRSESRRVVYWGHSEHVGKIISDQTPMGSTGSFLKRDLGSDYVAIGALTGEGQYMTWPANKAAIYAVPPPETGTYEAYFELGPRPAFLVPMQSSVPQWLSTPSSYFFAGTVPLTPPYLRGSLPAKLDAVIYIHTTTPIHAF